MPKRSASPSVAMPMCALVSRIWLAQVFEQMIVGLGRMAAEEHVAIVVDGCHLHARVAQQRIRIAAGRTPQRIVDHAQSSFLDGGEVHDFAQACQVHFPGSRGCALAVVSARATAPV